MTRGHGPGRTLARVRARLLPAAAAMTVLLAGCGPAGTDRGTAREPDPGRSPASAGAAPAEGSAEVVATVARGLAAPWDMVQLPGGDLLVSLRDEGTIQHVDAGTGEVTLAGAVPGVSPGGEGGLLGLALEPDPGPRPALFVYATTAGDNRISRFRYDPAAPPGERLGDGETVLDGIPRGEALHNGGGLAFGPDGMLYVATGDTGARSQAQDEESLAGKILRLDPDGGPPPPGNPDPDSYVYSLGHRNVQGLAWDGSGQLWATEFGEDTWDELNRIEPGGNYGWPLHEGPGGEADGFTDPVLWWSPADASPSGLAYSQGSLWLAALRGERLWRVPLDGGAPAAEPQAFLHGEYGRLRSVLAPGGDELLVLTNETDSRGSPGAGDDRILRLRVS